MARNKASNDKNFIPPTKYPKPPKGTKNKAPPEPKPVPKFDDDDDFGGCAHGPPTCAHHRCKG